MTDLPDPADLPLDNPHPLNPPPDVGPDGRLRVRFSRCNACEREIVDGEEVQVRTLHDPEGGEAWTIAVHTPACPVACTCGHDPAEHFRGTGECMASTPDETWACGCHEYRPADAPSSPM